jgi:site-specific DNA-methyltransferase (adenine-specific)
MDPYYSDDAVTIYHGDCREILPALTFDVVVTDPPYGVSVVKKDGRTGFTSKQAASREYRPVEGDDIPLDPRWLLDHGRRQIVFGVSHFVAWPGPGRLLVWDKRDGMGSNNFADVEVAWDSKRGPSRLIRHRQLGMIADLGDLPRVHPTQKPLSVMRWIVDQCTDQTDTVCDPFMGSGTTLRAAMDLGRKAIGIDIDESYCEIAAKRLGQQVLAL